MTELNFFDSIAMPIGWLISILIAASIVTYFVIAYSKAKGLVHTSYTFDRISDVYWQWYWSDDANVLVPLCPQCAHQLEMDQQNLTDSSSTTSVSCNKCGFSKQWSMSSRQLEKKIMKEINLRNEEFEKEVAKV